MLDHPACFLVLALVAACGGPDIEPRSGTWTYKDVIVTANSCTAAPSVPDGDFTLKVLGEGRFTIEAESLHKPLDCSHAGDDFSCPETLVIEEEPDIDDVLVLVSVEVEGTLKSATEFSGTEVIRTSCKGSGCAVVFADSGERVPCESTLSFTGVAK